eukprot:g29073.t1
MAVSSRSATRGGRAGNAEVLCLSAPVRSSLMQRFPRSTPLELVQSLASLLREFTEPVRGSTRQELQLMAFGRLCFYMPWQKTSQECPFLRGTEDLGTRQGVWMRLAILRQSRWAEESPHVPTVNALPMVQDMLMQIPPHMLEAPFTGFSHPNCCLLHRESYVSLLQLTLDEQVLAFVYVTGNWTDAVGKRSEELGPDALRIRPGLFWAPEHLVMIQSDVGLEHLSRPEPAMPMPAIPAVGDTPAANPVPSEPNPSEKPLHIRCEDGSLLEVEKMDIPRRLKHVLREMDLDASGFVDEKNLEDSLKILRHLKKGLDTDGSGHVTNQEMEDGVSLLTLLMTLGRTRTEKANNSKEMPYKHLPEQIQEVMREWDLDGSGMVGVEELTAAAGAYKKIQQEGRLMRKIIVAMALVILFLMGAMFALSITAVEITKAMRGTSTGVMESTDPEGNQIVVKVASSDFEMAADGSLIIRGAIGANVSWQLGVVLRHDSRLSSRKQLTLKDNLGHTLKVTITSFQRLRLRSSRCGSVIHLYSEKGRFTLDDYEMTADAAMEAYVKDAGMEGFFNMLEDVEWECESVDLPSPNDIPQYYHATIHVKHLHNRPAKAYSKYFKDEDGQWLLLPGVLEENGKIYKTWREELVKSAGVTAYLSEYAMHPLQRELRLKKGGVQATIEGMGRTGYRCFLEAPEPSSMKSAAGAAVPTMEFMGVHVENGTVLRKWRLDPMGDLDEQDEGSENTIGMMEAGLIPNRVDYYDVDTDPSGRFDTWLEGIHPKTNPWTLWLWHPEFGSLPQSSGSEGSMRLSGSEA